MEKSREEINKTEQDYWNEGKLDRSKIKPLRRHSFHFSYKREAKILDELLVKFNDKDVLELGSYTWKPWFKGKVNPKSLTCINISERELKNGESLVTNEKFPINFHLMDANSLTFPDNSFDIVFGGAILHHLDIEKTLNHVYRVLKPNGFIVFLEPLNMNPLYKIYRKLNPQERTPDEHALVASDFKIIKEKFSFQHYFFDFFSVITGYISLKLIGDKNHGNWFNRFGSNLDVLVSKIPFMYVFFARVILFGHKK